MKYTIITSAYNRPDFLEPQLRSLQKWVADFDFVVYDNSSDGSISRECTRLGIRCVPCQMRRRQRFDASQIAAFCLNKMIRDYENHDGILCIIDSDMFLINKLPDLNGNSMAYVEQTRPGGVVYPWTGFMMVDMQKLKDRHEMSFSIGHGGDTGGAMYPYLLKHKPNFLRLNMWTIIDGVRHSKNGVDITSPHEFESKMHKMIIGLCEPMNFDVFGVDGCAFEECFILHYKSATWWSPDISDYHTIKTEAFVKFLEERNK